MEKSILETSQLLEIYLQLSNQVVGIKHLKTQESYDRHEFMTHKYPMYHCYYVKLASRGRSFKASAKEMACETGSKVIGLEPYFDDKSGVKAWDAIKVYANTELSQSKHGLLRPKNSNQAGIAIGALSRFNEEPDTLIIIVNAYQMMRLSQGYSYHFKEDLSIRMSGMCGVCYESSKYPYDSQKMNISSLCSGTRFICQWDDNLMMVSMPYTLIDQVMDGIIKTANPCEVDEIKKKIQALIDNPETLQLQENYFWTP